MLRIFNEIQREMAATLWCHKWGSRVLSYLNAAEFFIQIPKIDGPYNARGSDEKLYVSREVQKKETIWET
jgi:hypothetical protein